MVIYTIFLNAGTVIVNNDSKFKKFWAIHYIKQDIADLCNKGCLTDKITGINIEFIVTQPMS